ncbi:MAG: amidohydrolase, partial [Elusimicrobiota bacterium]|nr:amidohydrolase [Elusimicrobiota bacterium]
MNSEIKSLISSVKEDMIKWRRHFHENPEASFHEFKTAEYIKSELSALPNVQISQITPNNVQILIKGAKPGKRIALRADIDALPVEENSGETFCSKNKGLMHACGHDSHTAMLMGAVKAISKIADKMKGEVLFIFQHAEELPPGGAIDLIRAGVLDKTDMIFGIHCNPNYPTGVISYNDGVHCASTDNFSILIKGRGAHGSMPEKSIDPIVIGSQIVNALQTIVSRRISPDEAPVVTIATFRAEGEFNIIPETAYLAGTARTHHKDLRDKLLELIEKTVKGIVEIYDAQYEFKIIRGYPAGVNNKEAISVLKETYEQYLSPDYKLVINEKAMFGGEDFAYYQEKV